MFLDLFIIGRDFFRSSHSQNQKYNVNRDDKLGSTCWIILSALIATRNQLKMINRVNNMAQLHLREVTYIYTQHLYFPPNKSLAPFLNFPKAWETYSLLWFLHANASSQWGPPVSTLSSWSINCDHLKFGILPFVLMSAWWKDSATCLSFQQYSSSVLASICALFSVPWQFNVIVEVSLWRMCKSVRIVSIF